MTSRQRLRKALQRQEPDRVPIDFGQDFHNGINEVAYRNLLTYLQSEAHQNSASNPESEILKHS